MMYVIHAPPSPIIVFTFKSRKLGYKRQNGTGTGTGSRVLCIRNVSERKDVTKHADCLTPQ